MEAPTIGVGRLLKEGGIFFVPDHQRDYSWTEDEIEQLFQDIDGARQSGQSEYFIGLMVFMPRTDQEYIILDGQQRLVTTTIILAAIRSWLRARDFAEDAQQIQSNFIAVRELGCKDLNPRLILNENNNTLFNDHVIKESPNEEIMQRLDQMKRYDPNRRLLEANLFCRKRIAEIGGSSSNAQEGATKLFEWVRYLENGVKIVRLNVQSESNAYTVFETLNDRGLDLSVLDLVKNYLYGNAGKGIPLRDIQMRWSQMMANLINVRADEFLKSWWTSRNGRVQTPQLFSRFKSHVDNAEAAISISKDMLSTSEQYAALEIADDPMWADYPQSTKESLRALKLLGAQQVHPIILSALEKFNQHEIERLIKLLEIMIVRYQLIGGGRTGRLEISCARLAHLIFDGTCKTSTKSFDLLKDVFPNDSEFSDAFKTKQERNNQKARYLLSRLERQARLNKGDAISASELDPSESLTLEHVFPKSPGHEWSGAATQDPSFADDCTYRLGNLCLLTNINRSLGNKSFGDKKKVFSKSSLIMTSEICETKQWNREAVEKRQVEMAKIAANYWRFN